MRVPEQKNYRVAYTAIWPTEAAKPQWFSALPVSPGEPMVIVQIRRAPRDDRWKIITLVHVCGDAPVRHDQPAIYV